MGEGATGMKETAIVNDPGLQLSPQETVRQLSAQIPILREELGGLRGRARPPTARRPRRQATGEATCARSVAHGDGAGGDLRVDLVAHPVRPTASRRARQGPPRAWAWGTSVSGTGSRV